ncbi:MAG: sulfite exporter TauE/SafE family protein [Acidimicrobiales bacterium]
MTLWGVFITGLIAGGASCAAVQGGLLTGLVARRQPGSTVVGADEYPETATAAMRRAARLDDAIPVGGFLAGKLVSHTVLGAGLGLLGDAVQIGFRTRAFIQITAGVLMVAMAAHLLGFRAFARLVPQPPQRWARLVRRNARSASAGAPAMLGLATVLIPCGVTLSVEFLAIASGSAVEGAAIMAAFVIGTAPLFAVLGYAARRSATLLRGQLAKVAALAVLVAGVLSINAGLVLSGSSTTLATVWASVAGRPASTAASDTAAAVPASEDGVQRVVVSVRDTGYSPAVVRVKAGIPTELTFRTQGTQGCTRTVVVPSMKVGRQLPASGDTTLDLGMLAPGRLRYTCGMGMYSGAIEAT